MRGKKRKLAAVGLLLGMILGLFSGCARREEGPPTLWIVTERTEWNGMNNQATQYIKKFQELHPEFEVTLDILPKDKAGRSQYIGKLKGMIMAGRGPDVYLLPTDTTDVMRKEFEPKDNLGPVPEEFKRVTEVTTDTDYYMPTERQISRELEPLFWDVEQVMRNGLFADISSYYDADDSLGKECLQTTIMDAGTYRDGRYILPLRYDIPVLYAVVEDLAPFGLSLDDVNVNISKLMDLAIQSGDPAIACSVEPFILRLGRGFSMLSPPMDYETDTVVATKDSIADFLKQIQALETIIGENAEHRIVRLEHFAWDEYRLLFENGRRGGLVTGIYYHKMFPVTYPMRVSSLIDMPLVKLRSTSEEREYAMIPLKDLSNQVTAYVTYFGAVGVGCEHPAEAYEFLRMFLSEESQFEYNRPYRKIPFFQTHRMEARLMEDGWPVRVKGSANVFWRLERNGRRELPNVRGIDITESGFPPLQAKIDNVYFGCVLEQDFAAMVRSLNDQDTGEPTDVDIDAMAEEFIEKLTWHVMEG